MCDRVIITGGNGFIGRSMVEYFLSQNVKIVSIGRQSQSVISHKNLTYVQCDLNDFAKLKKMIPKRKYDTFIHLAWEGSYGEKQKDWSIQKNNILLTMKCLELASQLGCARFLCAGSLHEYETEYSTHYVAELPKQSNIYGYSKFLTHIMCKHMAAKLNIDLIWPVITNAYGPGEKSSRFIITTLKKM